MRIRVVKPDFWSDSTLSRLPDAIRLFYIGLWMEADDAGWLKWEPSEIAAGLYPYRGTRSREKQVQEWFGVLMAQNRVVLHDCGHAVIPTFGRHQRTTGGNRTTRVRDHHSTYCQSGQVRTDTDEYVRKVREGKVKEGKHVRLIEGRFEAVE